jgi:hypothetical protein
MSFRSMFVFVNGLAQTFGDHMGKVILGVAPAAGFTAPALYTGLIAPALWSLHFTHPDLVGRVLLQVMCIAVAVFQP